MAPSILILSFISSPNGRRRAEELLEDLFVKHDLGKIVGGGQDLRTGDFDLEIATPDAGSLLEQVERFLANEQDLELRDAVLIER